MVEVVVVIIVEVMMILFSPCDLLTLVTFYRTLLCSPSHPFQGPVGNGNVICISVYAGENFDFGFGKGHALWVENIDKACI